MKYKDAWVIGPNGGLVAAWVVVDDGLAADAKDDLVWITAHPNGPDTKGRHIPLDKKGGMGGKFNGQHIALIPRKRQWQPNEIEKNNKVKIKAERYKGYFTRLLSKNKTIFAGKKSAQNKNTPSTICPLMGTQKKNLSLC